jgi:hypothetical protein
MNENEVDGDDRHDNDEISQLSESVDLLSDSIRISAQPLLEKSLSHLFANHKQLRAYELANGAKSTREIAILVGAGQKTISRWLVAWEKLGIVEQVGVRGQYTRKYSLMDLATIHNDKKWLFIEGDYKEEGGEK